MAEFKQVSTTSLFVSAESIEDSGVFIVLKHVMYSSRSLSPSNLSKSITDFLEQPVISSIARINK